jgi:hypothetical protein
MIAKKIYLKTLELRVIERVHGYPFNYPPLFPKEGTGGVLSYLALNKPIPKVTTLTVKISDPQ